MPDIAPYLNALVEIVLLAARIAGCVSIAAFCLCAIIMVCARDSKRREPRKNTSPKIRKTYRSPGQSEAQNAYALYEIVFHDCEGHTVCMSHRTYLN